MKTQTPQTVLIQWIGLGARSDVSADDPVPVRAARVVSASVSAIWIVGDDSDEGRKRCETIADRCARAAPSAFVGSAVIDASGHEDDAARLREKLRGRFERVRCLSPRARARSYVTVDDLAAHIAAQSIGASRAPTRFLVSCATGTAAKIAALLAEMGDALANAADQRGDGDDALGLLRWRAHPSAGEEEFSQQWVERFGVERDSLGRSRRARERVLRWAPHGVPVLLLGPTGAGKSTIAKELHRLWWPGAPLSLTQVNCATLEPGTAAAELFGVKKGAFTDAKADLPGHFRAAAQGSHTLFLDEFAELPSLTQGKLLTAMEATADNDGARCYRFMPVGESKSVAVPVEKLRVVLATNRSLPDPSSDANASVLRADLAARVNQLVLRVPSISEAPASLPSLILEALERVAGPMMRQGSAKGAGAQGVWLPDQSAFVALLDLALDPQRRWAYNHRDLERLALALAFRVKTAGRSRLARSRLAVAPEDVHAAFRQVVPVVVRDEARAAEAEEGGPASVALPSSMTDAYRRALEPKTLADRYEGILLWQAWASSGQNSAASWRRLVEWSAFAPGRSAQSSTNASSSFRQRWRRVYGDLAPP